MTADPPDRKSLRRLPVYSCLTPMLSADGA